MALCDTQKISDRLDMNIERGDSNKRNITLKCSTKENIAYCLCMWLTYSTLIGYRALFYINPSDTLSNIPMACMISLYDTAKYRMVT